jgi:hypothetical protein
MAEKSGVMDKLPEVPMIGRKGTIALAAWYYSKHGGGHMAAQVAIIAAVMAGEEFGKDQKITGDVEGDDE